MERILNFIHASEAYRQGIFGQGIGVAVLDTGIYPHRDLQGRIVYFRDYVQGKLSPYDDNGHGTHICGIIGGNSQGAHRGVAPGCRLYGFKVLDQRGNGKIGDTCHAVEEILKINAAGKYQIHIINISVGMMETVQPALQKRLLETVEKAWDKGIVVLAAAGNNGPGENTVTSPGISKKIITVGSLDDGAGDSMGNPGSGYSGRGPTAACVVKPEILMPGTNIVSCANRGLGYVRKSGTSMAVPVLTGMIALLLCKYPSMTPNEIKMRLFYAASKEGLKPEQKSWGTITMDRLLRVSGSLYSTFYTSKQK